jgi:hypothetical protein
MAPRSTDLPSDEPRIDALPVATARAPRAGARLGRSTLQGLVGRVALVALGTGVAALVTLKQEHGASSDRRAALAEVLDARGLVTDADSVVFVDGPTGLFRSATGSARAVVRARPKPGPDGEEQASEVYLVRARLSPAGALLDVGGVHNLSNTTGADESVPIVRGEQVAYASRSEVEGAPSTLTLLDLSGGPRPEGWGGLERVQTGLTRLQETGRWGGVARRLFVIEGKGEVVPRFDGAGWAVDCDGRTAHLDEPGLPGWVVEEPFELARPGNLTTWAVDRVRAEIGDESMQAIKQVAFTALDFVLRNKEELTGDTGEAAIAEDLGGTELAPPSRDVPVDPELGWPPPPLEPWVTPALPGEGQWNAKEEDAWFRQQPGLPSAFLTTFIRSDRGRKATRVYVVLWDPRRIELHMMAGTVEPKSATGKAGPGLIPRTPDMMRRVVAASNAGFQALHGEYGMMADGTVYLPPKPFAATVASMRDGSTAFGTWPDDPTVPDDVLSYRQNMTVMVQDEKFNPYGRTWWGGTVPGAEDKTHTVRTGICLTREGFTGYFYGADLSPEALAQAMIQTRCSYGLALDMNAGHAGLEFYNVAPKGELPPLDRPLQRDWEAEGEVPQMPGWDFRARRMIRGMGLMNFPRYIKREARDFFYLSLRHVLPGPAVPTAISPPLEGEGVWRVKGLPQHGFPYAMATTVVRPDAAAPERRFRLLALDPRTFEVARDARAERPLVAVLDPGAATEGESVWLDARSFSVGAEPPRKSAVRVATGSPTATEGRGVVGVHDESGMLIYAELDGVAPASVTAMAELLGKLGCSQRVVLAEPLGVALGGHTSLAEAPVHPPSGPSAVRLVRSEAARGRRFFEDTPVVSRDVWYPKQQHRVRYFKKAD